MVCSYKSCHLRRSTNQTQVSNHLLSITQVIWFFVIEGKGKKIPPQPETSGMDKKGFSEFPL